MPLKAVLFDLDDTLVDHLHSARTALLAVQAQYECFQPVSFAELEHTHRELLEHYHLNVLHGSMTLDEARMERFRQLFLRYGESVSQTTAQEVVTLYRHGYLGAERPVAGAIALLQRLRANDLRIGIVTNSTVEEQVGKVKRMKLDGLFDTLVVSEAVGTPKPDPRIFDYALQQLGCACHEAVMVGDSWSADIMGARAANIRAIWFNRYSSKCPDPSWAQEITALEPPDEIVDLILQHQ
jgi:putative hydrolase of the HAD superfamily